MPESVLELDVILSPPDPRLIDVKDRAAEWVNNFSLKVSSKVPGSAKRRYLCSNPVSDYTAVTTKCLNRGDFP